MNSVTKVRLASSVQLLENSCLYRGENRSDKSWRVHVWWQVSDELHVLFRLLHVKLVGGEEEDEWVD